MLKNLLGIEPPARAQYIRVILEELTRLQSHLLGMGEFGEFIGFVSMFMYTIREREEILGLIDMVTGARVTHSYLKFGGVRDDLPAGFKEKAIPVLNKLKKAVNDFEEMFHTDRIYRERTVGVGVLTADVAKSLGVSGPALRATGVPFDIRKNEPYLVYKDLDFKVCTETAGDCFARVQVRLNEMRESIYILEQCLDQHPERSALPGRHSLRQKNSCNESSCRRSIPQSRRPERRNGDVHDIRRLRQTIQGKSQRTLLSNSAGSASTYHRHNSCRCGSNFGQHGRLYQ